MTTVAAVQVMAAIPIALGLVADPAGGGTLLTAEWAWALRGGGTAVRTVRLDELAAPQADLALIIVDSVPLSAEALGGLREWVRNGGLLVYADGMSAMETWDASKGIRKLSDSIDPNFLGVHAQGRDPAHIGAYPDIVAGSPLLSPLVAGDALRLGQQGYGNDRRYEANPEAKVLARSASLSLGPGDFVLTSTAPSIVLNTFGKGRVLFLSFSLGQVAACYPHYRYDDVVSDCSGAGNAHALMRWLTANLLWEERHLQIPLMWESMGDRQQTVMITGDVHDHTADREIKAAVHMAQTFADLHIPLSLYLEGNIGRRSPAMVEALQKLPDIETSTHGLDGTVYVKNRFLFGAFGIFHHQHQAESLLRIGHFPAQRPWLLSERSHGWISDESAWWALGLSGIGLIFDNVADQVGQHTPWRVPPKWYDGGEARRLFVPIYEHSVRTSRTDFRLADDQAMNLASLSSCQADPVDPEVNLKTYFDHASRWHRINSRLATVGGLSEVWIWHPFGIEAQRGWALLRETVENWRSQEGAAFARGDVVANWRANRERYRVVSSYDAEGQLTALNLSAPKAEIYRLPPGAPDAASSVSYWVVGPAELPGWSSRRVQDPYGRVITVLTQALHGAVR